MIHVWNDTFVLKWSCCFRSRLGGYWWKASAGCPHNQWIFCQQLDGHCCAFGSDGPHISKTATQVLGYNASVGFIDSSRVYNGLCEQVGAVPVAWIRMIYCRSISPALIDLGKQSQPGLQLLESCTGSHTTTCSAIASWTLFLVKCAAGFWMAGCGSLRG